MLHNNDIIKHDRSMDVCFQIFGIIETNQYYRLSGIWINLAYVKSYPMLKGNIEITKVDLNNWLKLDSNDHFISCFRNGKWEPVVIKK